MTPHTRRLACGVALVITLSACGALPRSTSGQDEPSALAGGTQEPPSAEEPRPAQDEARPTANKPQPGRPDPGIVAPAVSTALPVEARNLRLARSGERELALRFDLFNGTDKELSLGTLGLDARERLVALVDPVTGAAYGLAGNSGEGRISEDVDVEPGGSTPVTAVFTAPPQETAELLVALNGMRPVMVPIGAAGPEDGEVPPGQGDAQVGALVCKVGKGSKEAFTLPSDVLFEFGSAKLSPAARSAITGLGERVGASSGTVTVDGHTDGVGGDADNQTLSERRAQAVRQALGPSLGDSFDYRAKGHGESDPVAPNAKPDGSDDPRGRAKNRRVEVEVDGEREPAAPVSGGELSDAGLRAEVDSVRRLSGYLLASVKVTNPGSDPAPLSYENHFTPKELTTGQLSVSGPGSRHELCGFAEPTYFDFVGTLSSGFMPGKLDVLPAGAEVTLWGLVPAPPENVASVKIQLGGYGEPLDAQITDG
ncbi:OmpA family protein [Nonomuraea endophytica]|uniref:Outer membrane protein OmpA-like peptidoglycan-associated protein n=1 Tax=Nonomuraea endophytica TaxID=714136 RepID=A0A7W8A7V6_9ACTN|nr:OmpA family protein [Nonomuraea endophytica]MBB5081232.1 outer membrane protein OmpA-like peptidoglycan-associated protein [Nonomuraea endophytica]